MKKAGHNGVSEEDLVAIATVTETRVPHVAGRLESVKDRPNSVTTAAEAPESHRLTIAMMNPLKDQKIEGDAAEVAARHRSNQTRAASLLDAENEAVAALASG